MVIEWDALSEARGGQARSEMEVSNSRNAMVKSLRG